MNLRKLEDLKYDRDFLGRCIKANRKYRFLNDNEIAEFDEVLKEIELFKDFNIGKMDNIKSDIIRCRNIAFERLENLTIDERIKVYKSME